MAPPSDSKPATQSPGGPPLTSPRAGSFRNLNGAAAATQPKQSAASRLVCPLMAFVVLPILVVVAVSQINTVLAYKSYVWRADDIAAVARRMGHIPKQHLLGNISVALQDLAPGHFIVKQPEWVIINAGGWMGHFAVFHATLTEYVLLFGTEIPQTGHSGRYWADIWDTMILGEYIQWPEGAMFTNRYLPGDTVFHGQWEAAGMSWTGGTYMLEYGRGVIPSTLFFAFADTVTSTLDVFTLVKTLRVYAQAVLPELLNGYI